MDSYDRPRKIDAFDSGHNPSGDWQQNLSGSIWAQMRPQEQRSPQTSQKQEGRTSARDLREETQAIDCNYEPNRNRSYRGEYITRDVDPSRRSVRNGESLLSIASDHLGPGASDQDIQRHSREIAELNAMTEDRPLCVGRVLELPGHTRSGGFVTREFDGTLTRWQNGTQRMQFHENAGYVIYPDGRTLRWGVEHPRRFRVSSNPAQFVSLGDNYRGEVINRNVEPSRHQYQAGETIEQIAAAHLGQNTTPEEIQRHVREIRHVNRINDGNPLSPGMYLSLPGHTESGGFVTDDIGMPRLTVWQNDTVRIELANGRGMVVRADGSGSHWGPAPFHNFHWSAAEANEYTYPPPAHWLNR